MDQDIKNVILGSVLGDGFITKPTKNGSRLWIKYNDKSFLYLKWLHEQLEPLGVGLIKSRKIYNQHYFLTNPCQEVAQIRNCFYPKGKKIIPVNICDILRDPKSLAIWYMDDGSLDYRPKYHQMHI